MLQKTVLEQWEKFEYGWNTRKQYCIMVEFPDFDYYAMFQQDSVLVLLVVGESKPRVHVTHCIVLATSW